MFLQLWNTRSTCKIDGDRNENVQYFALKNSLEKYQKITVMYLFMDLSMCFAWAFHTHTHIWIAIESRTYKFSSRAILRDGQPVPVARFPFPGSQVLNRWVDLRPGNWLPDRKMVGRKTSKLICSRCCHSKLATCRRFMSIK